MEAAEGLMVSQYLVPECTSFLYLRKGALFAIRAAQQSQGFFWLCGTCAGNFNIDTGLDGSVRLVASQRPRTKDFIIMQSLSGQVNVRTRTL